MMFAGNTGLSFVKTVYRILYPSIWMKERFKGSLKLMNLGEDNGIFR
jgi:hypothetical protein